jgi:hypothetical protein
MCNCLWVINPVDNPITRLRSLTRDNIFWAYKKYLKFSMSLLSGYSYLPYNKRFLATMINFTCGKFPSSAGNSHSYLQYLYHGLVSASMPPTCNQTLWHVITGFPCWNLGVTHHHYLRVTIPVKMTGSFTFNSRASPMLKLGRVTKLHLTTKSIQKLRHVNKLSSLPPTYTIPSYITSVQESLLCDYW